MFFVLVLLVVILGIAYVVISKVSSGNGEQETKNKTESEISSDDIINNDEELRNKNGVPSKGGLDWSLSSDGLVKNTYETVTNLDELTVFGITDYHKDKLLEEVREALKLKEDDNNLNSVADCSFYYENLKGNADIHPDGISEIIEQLHMGVWSKDKNFGTLQDCGDNIYEMTFKFNGIPWADDVTGSYLCGDAPDGDFLMLSGIESKQSLFWNFDDTNNLVKFSGFSFEVEENKKTISCSSYDKFYDVITDAMNKLKKFTDNEDEYFYNTRGSYSSYEKFTVESINICYAREIDEGNSDKFVPVITLNGERAVYNFSSNQWYTLKDAGYAISMESGNIYDWRTE
jgi:hypothetical protein